jgi:flavodoxin I
MTKRIGLFYGSTNGTTEWLAETIADTWAEAGMTKLEPINIADVDELTDLLEYDYLIIGCPTWDIGELQEDWDVKSPQISDLDMSGKLVAIFGSGDQEGYPDNFQDAIGILGKKFRECGATLVGFTSIDGYDFDESAGVENDKFMGLSIDEINQDSLTSERVQAWVTQIISEFDLTTE